jgi:hypothetical protein
MNTLCQAADAIFRRTHGLTIFGTDPITGNYSVAETKDLIAAKDADMAELASQSPSMLSAWRAKDPAAAGAWEKDYAALKSRYGRARDTANAALGPSKYVPLPDSLITLGAVDNAYKGILNALNPAWTSHTNAPGSLGDLSARLGQGSAMKMATYDAPQPRRSSDASMQILRYTPAVEKVAPAVERVVDPAMTAVEDAWHALQHKSGNVKEAFDLLKWLRDHPFLTAAGAASLGLLGLYILYRATAATAPIALRIAEVATPEGRVLHALRAVNAGLGAS